MHRWREIFCEGHLESIQVVGCKDQLTPVVTCFVKAKVFDPGCQVIHVSMGFHCCVLEDCHVNGRIAVHTCIIENHLFSQVLSVSLKMDAQVIRCLHKVFVHAVLSASSLNQSLEFNCESTWKWKLQIDAFEGAPLVFHGNPMVSLAPFFPSVVNLGQDRLCPCQQSLGEFGHIPLEASGIEGQPRLEKCLKAWMVQDVHLGIFEEQGTKRIESMTSPKDVHPSSA